MTNYWIFVSVPFTDFNVGTIWEMKTKIEATEKWSIGKWTPNRSRLSDGDKILFYQGGEEDGGRIVASAELDSKLQQSKDADCYVEIKNFEVLKKPVDLRALIGKLSFIRNKKHWGAYLQGGIVEIAQADYTKILKKSRSFACSSIGN
jgi:hypothetical protein